MSRITLTAEMQSLLSQANGRVELCDEEGNPIGFFEPQHERRGKYWPFSDEEVEEADKDKGPTSTLDDIAKRAGLL